MMTWVVRMVRSGAAQHDRLLLSEMKPVEVMDLFHPQMNEQLRTRPQDLRLAVEVTRRATRHERVELAPIAPGNFFHFQLAKHLMSKGLEDVYRSLLDLLPAHPVGAASALLDGIPDFRPMVYSDSVTNPHPNVANPNSNPNPGTTLWSDAPSPTFTVPAVDRKRLHQYVYAETKFDGWRAMIHVNEQREVFAFSRRAKNWMDPSGGDLRNLREAILKSLGMTPADAAAVSPPVSPSPATTTGAKPNQKTKRTQTDDVILDVEMVFWNTKMDEQIPFPYMMNIVKEVIKPGGGLTADDELVFHTPRATIERRSTTKDGASG